MYDINVKTKAQITCAEIAELIHSFLVEYIAALERLKIIPLTYNGKRGGHFFSAVLGQIVFILAGNNNISNVICKSVNESEIQLDPTTTHRVSCPLAS